MEHSALHALELLGQVITLGGAFFVLGLLRPASRLVAGDSEQENLKEAMLAASTRWVIWGALGAALATALSILVDTAETQIATIFGGVSPALVVKFALHTHVGRLSMMRIGVLLLTAAVARCRGTAKWWLVLVGALAGVALTGMVSHAAAQPTAHGVMLAAQMAHITGAALWVGVLIHLLAARKSLEGPDGEKGIGLLAEIVRRFSPVALTITMLLGISGTWMVCRFMTEPSAVPTSAYGLTLVVKLLMLTPAIYAGWLNFSIIRPAMMNLAGREEQSNGGNESEKSNLLKRFGRSLELEVTAGVLVITVAGILASVSPPGRVGEYRLTERQEEAMMRPHLPVVNIMDPSTFYGAPERTKADLRYAEFTHNWSGIMVCLLGLGWLMQNTRGRLGSMAERGWPLLLIPFALFVAVAADPEVWWYREVSPAQVLRDPQLLEHQLGAAMILILAWLGWRHHARKDSQGPMRYALPIVLTAGGILLLGHAHSTLSTTEELLNMINVQHAIFGAFIIVAGTVNWLGMRGLFPRRAGNLIWPCMVIGLGLFMAFCYRETV
jgi:putative copper resistance protein D